jgi:aminocarboxymuconate-semialdehyde decarboxylase
MNKTSRAQAIDVHTHFVPKHLAASPSGGAIDGWPSMAPGSTCCHRHVMIANKVYRAVTNQCWSAPKRLEDMAAMSIARQVLSPMPELLSYWLPAMAARTLLRDINEQMAEVVAAHPDRFTALAAVPLQDVDLAIEEMEYAAKVLKIPGLEIGSNINGRPLGAPEFEPFFAAAASLGMAIFVHAIRPAGAERLIGPASLEQAVGFPNEIGLAAASVITTNLISRHPGLRIAFSHGGGSLISILPRLQHAWRVFPALKSAIEISPVEQARLLYYDALVYDASTLRHLIAHFGGDALMLGTDYPFQICEMDPVGRLIEADLDAATVARLCHDNAARFLAQPF